MRRCSIFHLAAAWFGRAAALLMAFLLSTATLPANVSVNVSIWHGYDFYYPNLDLRATNPPATFHLIESSSGALWRQFGGTNGNNNFFLTNDLNAVLYECTNGLWKLYLNRGHASEELYFFHLSISEVTTNVLGDVTITYPQNGGIDVEPQPTCQWTGPTNLPHIQAHLYRENSGNSYYETLPGTTTSWAPGVLTPGNNTLFVNYFSNNYPGIVFSTPTNAAGVPLEGWKGSGDLHSYMFSSFQVAGGGGGGNANLVGHYPFDDPFDLGADASNNNHPGTSFYTGFGEQFPQYDFNGVAGGAVEFDGFNGLFWDNGLTNVFTGSYSISLWVKTTQSAGADDGSVLDGAGILDAGGNPMPMVLTGSRLAFDTGYDWDTLYSLAPVNSGDFTHVVVTYDASSALKSIFINGVLDSSDTDSAGSPSEAPYEINLGYSYNTSAGFVGLADDLQIYDAPLSASQVEFLYQNPGLTAAPGTNGPVDVVMELSIARNQDHASGDVFLCFPNLRSVSEPEAGEHRVESPNGKFSGGVNTSSSHILFSLDDLLDECTNGLWRLYINKDHPSQQIFTFTVALAGIDTNLLAPVTIHSPVNGSTNEPPNPAFTWSGPEGFDQIFAHVYQPNPYQSISYTNFAGTASNWPSPPTLNPGTNILHVNYRTNTTAHAAFSTPVDGLGQPLNSWSTEVILNSEASVRFVVVSALPPPVQLSAPARLDGNLRFEFLSQAGRAHTLQLRTNLTTAPWVDITNFTGNGSVIPVTVPLGAGQEYFRIRTQ